MLRKPNFLIVGAAKSGSTSLYQYLSQHPEVFMPVNKEPNYFVHEYQQKMNKECPSYSIDMNRMIFQKNEYYNLFKSAKTEHGAIGEATVTYLFKHSLAIQNIKKELDNPKIIIILRNPIERAFSQYAYACELGLENLNFKDAIEIENQRLNSNWSSNFAYIGQGMFSNQVKAYLKNFDDVHILLLDDLKKNLQLEMNKIFNFLKISGDYKIQKTKKYNVSGIPKIRAVHDFLIHNNKTKIILRKILPNYILRNLSVFVRSVNQFQKLEISLQDRNHLNNIYKKDIFELQKLIGRDLSNWI